MLLFNKRQIKNNFKSIILLFKILTFPLNSIYSLTECFQNLSLKAFLIYSHRPSRKNILLKNLLRLRQLKLKLLFSYVVT